MRVGAREGFAYNLVKTVSLATGNGYEVDSNTRLSGKAFSILLNFCPVPTLIF